MFTISPSPQIFFYYLPQCLSSPWNLPHTKLYLATMNPTKIGRLVFSGLFQGNIQVRVCLLCCQVDHIKLRVGRIPYKLDSQISQNHSFFSKHDFVNTNEQKSSNFGFLDFLFQVQGCIPESPDFCRMK